MSLPTLSKKESWRRRRGRELAWIPAGRVPPGLLHPMDLAHHPGAQPLNSLLSTRKVPTISKGQANAPWTNATHLHCPRGGVRGAQRALPPRLAQGALLPRGRTARAGPLGTLGRQGSRYRGSSWARRGPGTNLEGGATPRGRDPPRGLMGMTRHGEEGGAGAQGGRQTCVSV